MNYAILKKSVLVVAMLYSCISIAQFRDKEKVEDFNKDGVTDTLYTSIESGTSVSFKSIKITNGKTTETFEWHKEYAHSALKDIIVLPKALYRAENKPFLEIMKTEILPNKKDINPSLQWILNGHFNHKKLSENQYYDLIVNPKTKWRAANIELSDFYHIEVFGDTISKLYQKTYNIDMPEKFNMKSGFLMYSGFNHFGLTAQDSLELAKANEHYQIYPLKHGVIAKMNNHYRWLFISDVDLTGAPQKLRWQSIANIELIDKYVIIKQDLPPGSIYNIFIVNIETGICGRLKYDFSDSESNSSGTGPFLLENGHFTLSLDYGERFKKVALQDVLKELDKQE